MASIALGVMGLQRSLLSVVSELSPHKLREEFGFYLTMPPLASPTVTRAIIEQRLKHKHGNQTRIFMCLVLLTGLAK